MVKTKSAPIGFYDQTKTYDENFDSGPTALGPKDKPVKSSGPSKFKFLGFPINSPFGIPAGPILNSKYVKYAFERGFDVVVYKTQRSIEFKVNEFPNVIFIDVEGNMTLEKAAKSVVGSTETDKPIEDLTITNSFGNPSRGPNFWVADVKKALGYQDKGQLLIASAVGTIKPGFSPQDYYEDFAEAAALAKSTGASVVEVNLSCPNVANEGVLCYDHNAVNDIVKRVKKRLGSTPLVIKLGYYSPAQQKLLEAIIADISPHVAAFSVINTIPGSVVNEKGEQALPGPNRLQAGLCGASIKWAGLDMVERLARLRDKNNYTYEIIGVGGVMTPSDFQEYRQAGADLVQSATGAMWNPQLAAQIKETL